MRSSSFLIASLDDKLMVVLVCRQRSFDQKDFEEKLRRQREENRQRKAIVTVACTYLQKQIYGLTPLPPTSSPGRLKTCDFSCCLAFYEKSLE